ncbi:hypothetical protein JVU11DRAFT_8635 [Chiua virens]|nr:hypothetical protein JVU11DRAFT_8635 [Chiua virens]
MFIRTSEPAATVLLGFTAFFIYPDTASFLTHTEKTYLIGLLETDSQHLATHFEFQFVLQALKDYKTFLQFGICIGYVDKSHVNAREAIFLIFAWTSFLIPTFALALFIPTIINELGFTATKAQLLSVPPFTASTISMFLFGIYSDRQQLRGPYVIAGDFVSLVPVLAVMGAYSAISPALAWIGSNAGGDIKCGVSIAAVIGFATLGGICSSFIYFDPPRFKTGHGTMIGLLTFSMLLTLIAMWNYDRINKLKEKTCREYGITDDNKHEFKNDGDDSPLFRYTL